MDVGAILAAFEKHNVVNPVPRTILDATISSLISGPSEILIAWPNNRKAQYHQVLRSSVDYNAAMPLGDFTLVADGLTDTTYVFEGRDPRTEYFFSVVAVDSFGQVGYRSQPVYVAALDTTVVSTPEIPISPVEGGRWLFSSPNPFNPATRVSFEIGRDDLVGVKVYNTAGVLIRRIPPQRFSAGRQMVVWNGLDDRGRQMPSGHYFILLQGRGWTDRGKVVLVK